MKWLICLTSLLVTGAALQYAAANSNDPFISRLEILWNVQPGGYLPVDTRAPDIRLQLMSARSVGNDTYEIRVRRVR